MSENFYLIPFGIICFFLLLLIYLATQYLRDKIFHSKKNVLKILILIEYVLIVYVLYSSISLPYQLNEKDLFGKLSISRVMFHDSIYKGLIIIFILISLTSFNSIKLSLRESIKSYTLFLVISIFTVLLLYQINHYFFSLEKTYADGSIYHVDTKLKQINEIFICVIPSLIWLYFMSRFKKSEIGMFKKYVYNRLPIAIWYVVFSIIVIKPFLLSKSVINQLLNELGAYG